MANVWVMDTLMQYCAMHVCSTYMEGMPCAQCAAALVITMERMFKCNSQLRQYIYSGRLYHVYTSCACNSIYANAHTGSYTPRPLQNCVVGSYIARRFRQKSLSSASNQSKSMCKQPEPEYMYLVLSRQHFRPCQHHPPC